MKTRLIIATLFALAVGASQAMYITLPFPSLVQKSDLIFIGTAQVQTCRWNAAHTMIFTDVLFDDVKIIHANHSARQRLQASITVSQAGGTIGERGMGVSDTPRFTVSNRYLLCMRDDGQPYATPLVGAYQGLFEVITDHLASRSYILDAAGRAVLGADKGELRTTVGRVMNIHKGNLVFDHKPSALAPPRRAQVMPIITVGSGSVICVDAALPELAQEPLSLECFVGLISNALSTMPARQSLPTGQPRGHFFFLDDAGNVHTQDLPRLKPERFIEPFYPAEQPTQHKAAARNKRATQLDGDPLWCDAWQNLHIVFEQVPASWSEWVLNNNAMSYFNNSMDIYRYWDNDGSWGQNGQSEFGGYPSEADLLYQWGWSWAAEMAAGMCCSTYVSGGNRLTETDIVFNPSCNWTTSPEYAYRSSAFLYQPVLIHELGHSWGLMVFHDETYYSYREPTVMFSTRGLIEDGLGIHAVDSYLLRAMYNDQTAVLGTTDVGVESYYCSGGAYHDTTADKTSYARGEPMVLGWVTVENMSHQSVANATLSIRLSLDTTISSSDPLVSVLTYPSLSEEWYPQYRITTLIPSTVPTGTYYIGMVMAHAADAQSRNNTTRVKNKISVTMRELRVVLIPNEIALNGVTWKVDGGAAQSSGATAYGLAAGNHILTYSAPGYGWLTPPPTNVTIYTGRLTVVTQMFPKVVGIAAVWDYKDARNTDVLSTKDIRNYSNYGGIADLLMLGWCIGLADRTTGEWVNGPFAMKANKQGTRFVSIGKKDHNIVARRSKAWDGWITYPLRYKYWGQMPANRVVCIAPPLRSSDR